MPEHEIEWGKKDTHEKHLSVLIFEENGTDKESGRVESCGETKMWNCGMQNDIILKIDFRAKASARLLKEYSYDRMEITPGLGIILLRDAL